MSEHGPAVFIRALQALRRHREAHPRIVITQRWVAWHPDTTESYTGSTVAETWLHAMHHTNDTKDALLTQGWRVSLVERVEIAP